MQPRRTARIHALADVALIALFLAGLAAPFVDERLRRDDERGPGPELREAAPLPEFAFDIKNATSFPERYEAYFDDSFGLRDRLLRGHAIVKYFGLGVSPTAQVVLGDKGWLYYAGNSSVEDYRGVLPLSERELADWQSVLEEKRDRLKQSGIEYLFVIGPNKQSVYPEHMPRALNVVGPTRMDQWLAHMRAHSDVDVLDLRPALRDAKVPDRRDDHLYYPLGTHWYGRGGWVAYREILTHLAAHFPVLVPRPLEELMQVEIPGYGDSWGEAMYIADLLPQRDLTLRFPAPRARAVGSTEMGPRHKLVTEVDDARLPRALVFHDSFGPYLHQLMAEHFSHLAFCWQYEFDPAEVEIEKPDIVIELFVERVFVQLAPTNLIAGSSDSNRRAFQASSDVCFKLDVGADPPGLESRGEIEFTTVHEGIRPGIEIPIDRLSDIVVLPTFSFPKSGDILIKVVLDSPSTSLMEFWFRFAGDNEYKRRNNFRAQVHTGHNELYLRLNQPGVDGALMMRPGSEVGLYVLRELEVRGNTAP